MKEIIYTASPTQKYNIKNPNGKRLGEALEELLGEAIISATGDSYHGFQIFHHNDITLVALYSQDENKIKAFGNPNKIIEIKKGPIKELERLEF